MFILPLLKYAPPIFGFIGTVLIFFYGIPRKVDNDGKDSLLLERENDQEKREIKKYKLLGNFGLILIGLSFICDMILVVLS